MRSGGWLPWAAAASVVAVAIAAGCYSDDTDDGERPTDDRVITHADASADDDASSDAKSEAKTDATSDGASDGEMDASDAPLPDANDAGATDASADG